MHVDSVFRIASMTKLVTSLAVLMLQEEHGVDLDAPFSQYFPEFRQPQVLESFNRASVGYATHPALTPITVRQLLTHTSGFGYWFLSHELRALMAAEPEYYNPPFLLHEPGACFSYGTSADVLGQMVAPLSGLRLEDYFAQRILGPLGMRDTGYGLPADATRLVALHIRSAGGFTELPNEKVAEPPRGGSGLYSTARDYLQLLRMLLNNGRMGSARLLSAASVSELTRNQVGGLAVKRQRSAATQVTDDFVFMDGTQKFGLGVLIETRDRSSGRAAGSYGWAGLYNTYFWVDPRASLACVVLTQTRPFCARQSIAICDEIETCVYEAFAAR
jgi:methyl acetate hydrolase